ncbi:MAG: aromatic ring-hydroxylating dioxygenase subunit alpha [Myxococcales bacterium]|nr:aromatic ring-hydroxylating dioxygenase subunit alpha [Myxococcales bacterium]
MTGAHLERCWHPLAWSRELRRAPLSVRVLGRRVVAFRAADGRAVVLDDRCPHRGARLSTGRVRDGGLACGYHGWRFDAGGACTSIPSQLPHEPVSPRAAVRAFAVREVAGAVWFCFSDDPAEPDPPAWHHLGDRHAFTTTIDVEAGYLRVMENLVDNPHAGFLHAGLLRTGPTTPVSAEIRRTRRGVHIRTEGERARGSILSRLFGKRGEVFEHTEEYEHPHVIRTYFAREAGHISSQFVCVPVDEHRTRWFCRLTLDFAVAPLLMPVFRRVVLRILHQDREVLEQLGRDRRPGTHARRISTAADAPSLTVMRAAREFAEEGFRGPETERVTRVSYRL